jgi:hypothetical protein
MSSSAGIDAAVNPKQPRQSCGQATTTAKTKRQQCKKPKRTPEETKKDSRRPEHRHNMNNGTEHNEYSHKERTKWRTWRE